MHLFDEIHWPTIEEKTSLSNKLQDVQGCIGFINRTLIKIWKPWKNEAHKTWFNGRNKIYSMNNVLIHHHSLFIYIEFGHLGFYHDVNILHNFCIYYFIVNGCHHYFIHEDDSLEDLLGDLTYMWVKKCSSCTR